MQIIDEKVGLKAGVDKNEVPVGFQWQIRRTVRDDEGKVIADNVTVFEDVSLEDLQRHISKALGARDKDMAQDRVERDALAAERDEHKRASEAKTQALQQARNAIDALLK